VIRIKTQVVLTVVFQEYLTMERRMVLLLEVVWNLMVEMILRIVIPFSPLVKNTEFKIIVLLTVKKVLREKFIKEDQLLLLFLYIRTF